MRKTKIHLIEDNRLLRDGIKAMINKQPDLRVVAATGGNHDTLMHARTCTPHVVLIDLGSRSETNLRVVGVLTKELPDIKVIGMGIIPVQQHVVESVAAGVAGFILKDATNADVLGTIRTVAQGTKVLPPVLTGSLFAHVAHHAFPIRNGERAPAVRMTRRQREIIVLIAGGLSNKDIALRLDLSTYTVKSHIHNILATLSLHSRLEIAAFFHEEKALSSDTNVPDAVRSNSPILSSEKGSGSP